MFNYLYSYFRPLLALPDAREILQHSCLFYFVNQLHYFVTYLACNGGSLAKIIMSLINLQRSHPLQKHASYTQSAAVRAKTTTNTPPLNTKVHDPTTPLTKPPKSLPLTNRQALAIFQGQPNHSSRLLRKSNVRSTSKQPPTPL